MREVVFAATLTKLEQNIIHTDARHSDVDFLVQCHPQILLSLSFLPVVICSVSTQCFTCSSGRVMGKWKSVPQMNVNMLSFLELFLTHGMFLRTYSFIL